MKAGEITGLPEMPVEDITLSNVHVQAQTGFTCTNARQVSFYNVSVDTDAGPALAIKDCSEVDTVRLLAVRPHAGSALVTNNAK